MPYSAWGDQEASSRCHTPITPSHTVALPSSEPGMRAWASLTRKCNRRLVSTTAGPRPVKSLPDASLDTFRRDALTLDQPVMLPTGHFKDTLPAIKKWFHSSSSEAGLSVDYLQKYGSTIVPLEMTLADEFLRVNAPLNTFIE
ncbi:uncharacterized protein K489DRAFT_108115 [Dissoconium aciculare CBS 342.82]|uniref:Uncharacterized protein n=1 Tax=Dissoconium aciculare CBS 342.82 TaxID=1314786 RepID=A0A6J3MGV9_9PEZI|nr:uncharacterized protein K489DRAFT_108115 [Dissoconium aciculare CBS 342.82]KAF1826137.1 hypothetical protein K489DRAFT_108115 [Dissoconium aciculare CBS 342.82]